MSVLSPDPYSIAIYPPDLDRPVVWRFPIRHPPRNPDQRLGYVGLCVWCGHPITGAKTKRWHPNCVTVYRIAKFQADAIKHVWARDRGICAGCGLDSHKWGPEAEVQNPRMGYWQADHIVPLWSVDKKSEGAFRYWMLENLQTLCKWCHDKKTAAEAGERARKRRGK